MKENQTFNADLLALEHALRSRLHPIKPNQEFIGSLHTRLESSHIYQEQRKTAMVLLSTAGGLLVGLVIFLIGRGMLQDLK